MLIWVAKADILVRLGHIWKAKELSLMNAILIPQAVVKMVLAITLAQEEVLGKNIRLPVRIHSVM